MSTDSQSHHTAPPGRVIAAFAAIYIIWGSTYLGIRFAVETLPPFLMGGARFLTAGLMLYGWLRLRGLPAPAALHWRNAAVVGTLLIGFGNGGVCWAEQKAPSGLTALLIAVTPLWFALLDWLRSGGNRPRLMTLLGILVGFVGVGMLVGSREILNRNAIEPAAVLAVMLSSLAWAGGSLYARHTPKPESALMGIALQMIAGGGALLVAAVAAREPSRIAWVAVSGRSVLAFIYLIVIGSLVGFTAYSWLLKVSTPARISTYAYVNPVIAVFLGWAVGDEKLTPRILWAATVIVVGVIIITAGSDKAVRLSRRPLEAHRR